MNPVPPELATSVRLGDHATLSLRIHGVYDELPFWLVGSVSFTTAVAFGGLGGWMLAADFAPAFAAVLLALALALVAMPFAVCRPRHLDLRVGLHRLEIGRYSVALAEVEQVGVDTRGALIVRTRAGIRRFVLPDRSQRTWRALQDLLGAANRRAREASIGVVPRELARLRQRDG
jgi:hypothetical protein